jgi:asparagine synthase (glutamine-hydrolysing)
MCGIFGTVNYTIDNKDIVSKCLAHRGPEEQNWLLFDKVSLFHARLAIQDLSNAGKQPMTYNQYEIVFNGEIYNHQELRIKFKLKCKTNSDTETVLQLYDVLKDKMLNELDGMFAFTIYDRQANQLFIARDRAGKKPLYIYNDGDKLLFSSELNALKRVLPLKVNNATIEGYLQLGYFYKNTTPYLNVLELEAGTYQYIDINTLETQSTKWWNIQDKYLYPINDDFHTALQTTDHLLTGAVKNRLLSSDLEVGSFLSGGIDSGLVTAIASEFTSNLKTFTVSFKGAYNEAPLAKLVAQKYETNHHEIDISFDNLKNDIESIIASYGEPFADSSAIPSYYVSKEAKKHLTVILNGDGGDELFGGYRRHVLFNQLDPWKTSSLVKKSLNSLHYFLPESNDKKSLYNYFSRLVFLKSRENLEEVYLATTSDIFEGYRQFLLGDNKIVSHCLRTELEELNKLPLSSLQKLMIADFNNLLSGDLLVKIDIATMQHALEGRSPFLGKDLLNYIPSIHDAYKIKGTQSKYILRELAKKYLPTELIHQPKRGFEIPLKLWVNTVLREPIADYICAKNAFSDIFVDKKFMIDLINNKVKVGEEKRAKMLWNIFCLNVWHKKVYND